MRVAAVTAALMLAACQTVPSVEVDARKTRPDAIPYAEAEAKCRIMARAAKNDAALLKVAQRHEPGLINILMGTYQDPATKAAVSTFVDCMTVEGYVFVERPSKAN